MKLQKLALTALALSMSTAFAAGNTDKQAEGSSANQAPMAQSASANQPSTSTTDQSASSTANQSASSSANQAASTNGSQSEGQSAQADPQVRQVQQALKDKGHDPGPIDGVMGPQTKQALQGFQQAQGISGAGELDQQTLAALGVQGDSLASNASGNQPSSANSSSMGSADQASSSSANQGYTKQ